MKKKRKWLPAALFAVALLSLWTPGDKLSRLTVVQGVGFDYSTEGVTVTVQYLDLSKGTGKSDGIDGNITAAVSAHGADAEQAVKAVQAKLPEALYWSQCKLVVVGGSYQTTDLDSLCRLMQAQVKVRLNTVVMAAESAAAVLTEEQQETVVPAEAVYSLLEREGRVRTVNELMAMYCQGGYSLIKWKD